MGNNPVDNSTDENTTRPLVSLTEVVSELRQVELWSLVLQAVRIRHQINRRSLGWELLVSELDRAFAKAQLKAFEAENRNWPPTQDDGPDQVPGLDWPVITLLVVLVGFYNVTGPWTVDNSWFQNGAVSSRLIYSNGEWWRAVTGLFLHADPVHVLGNVCLGALVLSYLSVRTGAGTACALALGSGTAGNLINAFFHSSAHQSVGFSTAVFGVIGSLCGLRIAEKNQSLQSLILPLGAGVGLLAMLGSEGEKTDLGAHLWGMAVGLAFGFCWQKLTAHRENKGLGRLEEVVVSLGLAGAGWAWYLAWFSK